MRHLFIYSILFIYIILAILDSLTGLYLKLLTLDSWTQLSWLKGWKQRKLRFPLGWKSFSVKQKCGSVSGPASKPSIYPSILHPFSLCTQREVSLHEKWCDRWQKLVSPSVSAPLCPTHCFLSHFSLLSLFLSMLKQPSGADTHSVGPTHSVRDLDSLNNQVLWSFHLNRKLYHNLIHVI